jgi:hypothetical protein
VADIAFFFFFLVELGFEAGGLLLEPPAVHFAVIISEMGGLKNYLPRLLLF